MGLSKRSRDRRSVAQVESNELILTYTRAIGPAVRHAVRLRLWIEGMQKQLEKTAVTLRDNPSAALAHFQKTLGRPSYFLTSSSSGNWVVLLGPRPGAPADRAITPSKALVPSRAFDFSATPAPRTGLIHFFSVTLRILHQWLMHPMVDTREPSEPA